MRFINWLLHLFLVALFCWAVNLHAQTPGNAPQVADSFLEDSSMNGGIGTCPGSGTCDNFTEGAAAQDLIICGASQVDVTSGCGSGGSNSGWQFQDSLSTNLTMLTMGNNGGTPGSNATFYSGIGYTCVTSSPFPYRVNWTSGSGTTCEVGFQCYRVKHMCSAGSVTTDGSVVTSTGAGTAAAITNVSSSLTTHNLNDFIFSIAEKAQGSGGSNRIQAKGQLSELTYNGNLGMAWQIAPTLGSNSFSWADLRSGNNNTLVQTIAFKVPMGLADTAMPQAAVGVAYSATLHPYGGVSASPTFACTGLPSNGLALNTTTGEISGTPSSQGTLSLSCTFNDGVTTSPVDSLSLSIGGSFRTPVQNSTQITNFQNGGATATVTGTNCGDIIRVQPIGADNTHGGTSFKQIIDGSHGNSVTSSDGSPVQEYSFNTGSITGPSVEWVVGPLVSGGTKVISAFNSTASASGIVALVSDWSGVQGVLDAPLASNTIATTTSSSNTLTYPTVVPNEAVTIIGSTGMVVNSSPSFVTSTSVSAPFTSDGNGSASFFYYQYGHYISPTATSLTPTFNLVAPNWGCGTGNATCDPMVMLVTALRPRLPISGCGELIPVVRHVAQVY